MTDIRITERGERDSALGRVLQLKVCTSDYRLLGWREIWDVFTARYPGRWAVQVFPPADQLVDGKAVYHLFLCERPPHGLNLRG